MCFPSQVRVYLHNKRNQSGIKEYTIIYARVYHRDVTISLLTECAQHLFPPIYVSHDLEIAATNENIRTRENIHIILFIIYLCIPGVTDLFRSLANM